MQNDQGRGYSYEQEIEKKLYEVICLFSPLFWVTFTYLCEKCWKLDQLVKFFCHNCLSSRNLIG